MILLHGDVSGLCIRAVNLVLLLDYNRRKSSASGCVTENVANVGVTKQQRRTVVAARCVIREDIHHIPRTPCPHETALDTDRAR